MSLKKIHKFVVEFTVVAVTAYFVLRKTTDVTGTGLLAEVFQPTVVEYIVYGVSIFVSYSIVAKIYLFANDYFKENEVSNLHSPHYRCLLKNNKEIEKHLVDIRKGKFSVEGIESKHLYEENTQIVHTNFVEHLRSVLLDKKIECEDVFISLFHDENFDLNFGNIKKYTYSSHFDPTIHDTTCEEIDPSKPKYKNFACLKAIKTKKPVVCCNVSKEKTYKVDGEERRKSVKHYFGIPLKINGSVVGILNIEFHNKSVFSNNDEMKKFFQKEIQAFIYLYEYQISKQYFFRNLEVCLEKAA